MKLSRTFVLVTSLFAVATLAHAADEKISFEKAPSEVQKTLKDQAGSSKIVSVEKAKEDGKIQFEILTQSADGKKIEYVINADGTLDSIEEKTQMSDLPAEVAATAKKAIGASSPKAVEKVTKDGTVTYEVGYKAEGKKMEAVISADGKLLKNGEDAD